MLKPQKPDSVHAPYSTCAISYSVQCSSPFFFFFKALACICIFCLPEVFLLRNTLINLIMHRTATVGVKTVHLKNISHKAQSFDSRTL